MTSDDDRNFTQYGGIGRVSYEVMPGLKPFGEVQGDTRVHDRYLDRNGFARDSNGGYVKAGTSFEFSRLLNGEIAMGRAPLCRLQPAAAAGSAHDSLAGVDRNAADHGEIFFGYAAGRDHAARHRRHLGAHPHLRGAAG